MMQTSGHLVPDRSGATLIEVLVSIFVMGIGLLALLVLFPLGALNMAQAIRFDRASHVAQNGAALANCIPHNPLSLTDYGIRTDPDLIADPSNSSANYYNQAPGGNGFPLPVLSTTNYPTYIGQSYPIYVDPIGYQLSKVTQGPNTFSIFGKWPATLQPPSATNPAITGFARTSLSFFTAATPAPTLGQIAHWLTLPDDIEFDENGKPALPAGATPGGGIKRDARYSWAYMVQMPSWNPGGASPQNTADVNVVVYERRPLLAASGPTPADMPGESSYEAYAGTQLANGVTPPSNVIVLRWDPTLGQQPPPIRKGGWIYDATVVPNTAPTPPSIHGFFYRVVGVNIPGSLGANSADLEIQTDPKASINQGVVVVMENVIEVFDRGRIK
jgi:hypothetical protein